MAIQKKDPKPSAINWSKLDKRNQRRLLHMIARWHIDEGLSHYKVGKKMLAWVKENAAEAYNPKGALAPSTVGLDIKKAIKAGMMKVGPFYEIEFEDVIKRRCPDIALHGIDMQVAENSEELLEYIWEDLIDTMSKKVLNGDEYILGVSGGRTMLALALALSKVKKRWEELTTEESRALVTICSLTSGGLPNAFTAQSDIVTAIIAEYLGANARGLLGPARFKGPRHRKAFLAENYVQAHLELAENAATILTSVGYLGDPNSLIRLVLDKTDQSQPVGQYDDISDLLYNCYIGETGEESKPLNDALHNATYSVFNLAELKEKVASGHLRLIVVACDAEKGENSIKGILRKGLASQIYMDSDCAKGLISALA